MDNLKLLLLIPIILFISSCSDRELPTDSTEPGIQGLFKEISGNISGILQASNSPYKITGDLVVDRHSILQIEPGVELYFVSNTRLIVEGKLIVRGSYYYPVLFAAYDKDKPWRGIKFYNSANLSTIDFADIREINEPGDSIYQTSSIALINSSLEITHSWMFDNSAVHGGAIGLFNSSSAIVKNNIFDNNKATQFGGAIVAYKSNLILINNTLYQNISSNFGGGVVVEEPIRAELQNNIFYKNKASSGNPNFAYTLKDSTVIIEQYNYFATGNMDPLFYSTNDFRLSYYSPCKDAGNPEPIFNDVNGTRNDQGAYGGPLGNW